MTSPETESDPPVPWYRPVLRIIERFNTRDNIILGSGKFLRQKFKLWADFQNGRTTKINEIRKRAFVK